MHNIIKAAQDKFGAVISCIMTEGGDRPKYRLVIKRNNPPLADCPFMAITAMHQSAGEEVDFHWGNYDLTSRGAARVAGEHAKEMTAFVE